MSKTLSSVLKQRQTIERDFRLAIKNLSQAQSDTTIQRFRKQIQMIWVLYLDTFSWDDISKWSGLEKHSLVRFIKKYWKHLDIPSKFIFFEKAFKSKLNTEISLVNPIDEEYASWYKCNHPNHPRPSCPPTGMIYTMDPPVRPKVEGPSSEERIKVLEKQVADLKALVEEQNKITVEFGLERKKEIKSLAKKVENLDQDLDCIIKQVLLVN